jgi:hypothetical protein
VATPTRIPDEFYLAVGRTVVHAASLEHLLLELAAAVLADRKGLTHLAARSKWHRKPGTALIDLMLKSLDRVPPTDRPRFEADLKEARDALERRHITAHTSWPFGETDLMMFGVHPVGNEDVMEVVVSNADAIESDAARLQVAEETAVRWLEHVGAW